MTDSLMLLRADTPVHVGSGAVLSVIDLPIAREKVTQFPIIPGSGLKGALRQVAVEHPESSKDVIEDVFGPDSEHAADHAGAVAFAEARVFLFPVRSMKGLFAWLTCPTAMHRLARDAEGTDLGAKAAALCAFLREKKGDGDPDRVAYVSGDDCTLSDAGGQSRRVVFEELSFEARESPEAEAVAKAIQEAMGAEKERLAARSVVVSDDVFRYFALTATEVNAHVALDPETKTADEGKLFYVEDLPTETVLYSRVTVSRQRRKPAAGTSRRTAEEMKQRFWDALGATGNVLRFQVGGHETIGRGRVTAWLL